MAKRLKIFSSDNPQNIYIELLGVNFDVWRLDSITSLNAWFVMYLANKSCDVPILSKVRLWILEMWTPKSRWIPEHSIQTIIPKLVDNHVASKKLNRILTKKKFFFQIKKIIKLPFMELQSQHSWFPGNLCTSLIMACWSSHKLEDSFVLPPLSSNALLNAVSLQLTKTDSHALWSDSSSAWKWYVLLSINKNKKILNISGHSYLFLKKFSKTYKILNQSTVYHPQHF